MHITLTDANTLTLAFPPVEPALGFVKALPGAEYNGRAKVWTVGLCYLRRLLEQFPAATVDDREAVIAARLNLWRRWVRQMNCLGVWFALDVDLVTVVAVGAGVGPFLAEYVARRSSLLIQFLGDQRIPAEQPTPRPAPTPTRGEELLARSIRNAVKAEQRQAAIVAARHGQGRP